MLDPTKMSTSSSPKFIYPNWPAPNNVKAVMTTRHGGVSQLPFDSLNLGTHVEDQPDDVQQNRAILSKQLNLPNEPLWLNQIHGIEIARHGVNFQGDDADASISYQANQVCSIMTADCLPVLFCNTQGTTVAAAHAGWRSLQSGILEKCVSEMHSNADEVLVWLGVAIGPDAFEVGEEVRDAFIAVYPQSADAFVIKNERKGKWLADIYQLAKVHLTEAGINATNIYGGGQCTFTHATDFFSYRREARTGRMAALIWLD